MGCVSSEASREVEKERVSGENDLKSSSSLPLHGQGRRGTVPFKTILFWFFFFFFFFKENKCNLEEEKKFGSDSKMGYDTRLPEDAHYLSQTHSSI